MPQVSESRDQRQFRRYSVTFPCTVNTKKVRRGAERTVLQTETLDVSAGGLFFTAKADFKIGTKIECTLRLPIKSSRDNPVTIHCRGEIVRVVPLLAGAIGVGATINSVKFANPTQLPQLMEEAPPQRRSEHRRQD